MVLLSKPVLSLPHQCSDTVHLFNPNCLGASTSTFLNTLRIAIKIYGLFYSVYLYSIEMNSLF